MTRHKGFQLESHKQFFKRYAQQNCGRRCRGCFRMLLLDTLQHPATCACHWTWFCVFNSMKQANTFVHGVRLSYTYHVSQLQSVLLTFCSLEPCGGSIPPCKWLPSCISPITALLQLSCRIVESIEQPFSQRIDALFPACIALTLCCRDA